MVLLVIPMSLSSSPSSGDIHPKISTPIFWKCVSIARPKTIALMILTIFGGGRYWSREYGKNTKKLKLCIIMHKYAKYAFF